MQILCKIFNFFLNILNATLNVVVEAASGLIGAAFTVLDELGSKIFSSPLALLALGVGLWWLFASDDDDEPREKSLDLNKIPPGIVQEGL